MLQIFPFFSWLAAITSAVLLVVLWELGELRRNTGTLAFLGFLAAGYCQFFGSTPIVSALGLALQTMLALFLSLRWKLAS